MVLTMGEASASTEAQRFSTATGWYSGFTIE